MFVFLSSNKFRIFSENNVPPGSLVKITFFVILCAFANLGGLAGGISILVVCLIYFGNG